VRNLPLKKAALRKTDLLGLGGHCHCLAKENGGDNSNKLDIIVAYVV
jgi:hypothetical protein